MGTVSVSGLVAKQGGPAQASVCKRDRLDTEITKQGLEAERKLWAELTFNRKRGERKETPRVKGHLREGKFFLIHLLSLTITCSAN